MTDSTIVKLSSMAYAILALGLAALVYSRVDTESFQVDPVPTGEDLDIYAATLDTLATRGHTIILADSTVRAIGGPPRTFHGVIPSRDPVQVVSRKEILGPPHSSGDYWTWFRSQFPNADGWFALSEARIAPDGATARVGFEHACGWLCGGGGMVELAKRRGVWRVTSIRITWVS